MDHVKNWIETAPYSRALGVKLDDVKEDGARLVLPFAEQNSNPGNALHGGVAASLSVIGAQAVARAALGADSGPWHTVAFQINYLAAAIGEPVHAEARLLRRGKELCFVEVDVRTAEGKSISHATVATRGRFGAAAPDLAKAQGDDGHVEPGPMGANLHKLPFIGGRGIRAELMAGGRSRLTMNWTDPNADEDGGIHEGAVLALLDTTGAMAAWAETGPGRYKASTPSIQAQVMGATPRDDLVGYGVVKQRDNEIFWCDVEVASVSDGCVRARGTVIYRIVM